MLSFKIKIKFITSVHLVLRLNFTQTCFYLLAQDMGTIVGATEQWRPYNAAQSGSPKMLHAMHARAC